MLKFKYITAYLCKSYLYNSVSHFVPKVHIHCQAIYNKVFISYFRATNHFSSKL